MVEGKEIRVGIGDYKIAKSPDKLMTIGLGSCIGIALIDNKRECAALIHILLPDSTRFKEITNPIKYADIAIPRVVDELIKFGSEKKNIVAKIAGGAAMFKFTSVNIGGDIGYQNAKKVKEVLAQMGIEVKGEATGGNKGRSMFVTPQDGRVSIRVVGDEIKDL